LAWAHFDLRAVAVVLNEESMWIRGSPISDFCPIYIAAKNRPDYASQDQFVVSHNWLTQEAVYS
jgi:hypothetical protein